MSEPWHSLSSFASEGRWKPYMDIIRKHAGLQLAEISINNKCNLNCAHCSHTLRSYGRPEMELDNWIRVVNELAELGVEHFHICGKEPFLTTWLQDLLQTIDELKRKYGFRYGLVTNGTLLSLNLEWLSALSIDYIDVSIDGLRAGHDTLRGHGVFDRVTRQLGQAIKGLRECIITLATVVCSHNVKEIPEMIEHFREMGIRYFFLQPIQMIGKARERMDLRLSKLDLLNLLNELISRDGDGKALIELFVDYEFKEYMFATNELFRRSCKNDMMGNWLAYSIPLGELQLSLNWMCYAYWRSCMITPFGEYFGCARQALQRKRMDRPVSNVVDYPIAHLFCKSIKKKRLRSFHRPESGVGRKIEMTRLGISCCPLGNSQ